MIDDDNRITLSSIKSDYCSLVGNKSKEHFLEQTKEGKGQKKILMPHSLLMEMVAKLGHVMDKVEELGKMSQFREIRDDDDEIVVAFERPKMNTAKKTCLLMEEPSKTFFLPFDAFLW
ncbi:hypothetical protein KIW84_075832 [Lathyrus oleraceus]|uniref:Uncharacterized protein n=1 Tax=Pisum sativum TaxID=3888 RepID=A0A9D4VWD0_PEA|nr:hypothetical protein KIW84_075832 [Pisum sativum]